MDTNGFLCESKMHKGENTTYKARLVAQGFTQRPNINFEETYSPVVEAITFRHLISLVVSKGLNLHLTDIVTTYLYGLLDNEIYMKLFDGLKLP